MLTSRNGDRIRGFDINMFDITTFVIKPVITFLEDKARGDRARGSWSERRHLREDLRQVPCALPRCRIDRLRHERKVADHITQVLCARGVSSDGWMEA